MALLFGGEVLDTVVWDSLPAVKGHAIALDPSALDPVANDLDYAELLGAIQRMGKGRLYFNPLRHAVL